MCFCFLMEPSTTEIYTLSLHDALPILLSDASHYRSMARVQNPFGDGAASRRIIAAIGTYLQGAARGESDPCDRRRRVKRTDSAPTSPSMCALRNSLRQLPTPILPDKNP